MVKDTAIAILEAVGGLFDTTTTIAVSGAVAIPLGGEITQSIIGEQWPAWMEFALSMGWLAFMYTRMILKNRQDKRKRKNKEKN